MPKFKNITNQKFGRLLVISRAASIKYDSGQVVTCWNCLCDCGNSLIVRYTNLCKNHTQSCGCLKKERALKHGYNKKNGKHPLYSVWDGMKQRCTNKNDKYYKNYGGRGIIMHHTWISSPKTFIEWGLSHGYKNGLQIDRIDNDGNYSPENCRFVTQANNLRNTRLLRSTNNTGYRGVHQTKPNRWVASVQHGADGKKLGTFHSPLEAAESRDKYVIDNNLDLPLNFP